MIGFLRSLRDKSVEPWRRLQAARSITYYHAIFVRDDSVDFKPILEKLQELAGQQSRAGVPMSTSDERVEGKGNPGLIDTSEPAVIQKMRARMRLMHHPKSTEETYIHWVYRFIRHLDDDRLSVTARKRSATVENGVRPGSGPFRGIQIRRKSL